MAEEKKAEVGTKRPPGRPRTVRKRPAQVKEGVCSTPSQEGNVAEITLHDVMSVKKVFNLFKLMSAADIFIYFDERFFTIEANDHSGESSASARIDCTQAGRYYARESVAVSVQMARICAVIGLVRKDYKSITLSLRGDWQRSDMLTIELLTDIDSIEIFNVKLSNFQARPVSPVIDVSTYPVVVEIGGKKLKRLVASFDTISSMFEITKVDQSKLAYRLFSKERDINATYFATGVKKAPNSGIFAVTVASEYVKPFSNAIMADTIIMYADTHQRLVFAADVSGVFGVNFSVPFVALQR